jgi:4-hydroxybenzoate polyprenyltransferase
VKARLPSLAGAPLLWLAHFVAVYGLSSLLCAAGQRLPLAPGVATPWATALLTLGALLLAAAGLLRNGRRLRQRSSSGESEFFLAQANLLLYGLAAVGILWVALPGLLLPACR